jgi:SOS response regulatory protein OraA/RecX
VRAGTTGSPGPAAADPEEELREAMDTALSFLTARARSCDEVRRHLSKAGVAPEVVDRTEARLLELGLLDDAAFARSWVEEAVLRRRQAPPKAAAALAERGVDPEVIAAALDECCGGARGVGAVAAGRVGESGPSRVGGSGPSRVGGSGPSGAVRSGAALEFGSCRSGPGGGDVGGEFERALEVATKRLRVLHGSPESIHRRLWGFLARRGYDADVIERVCRQVVRPD